jgi:hypothetical protein
MHWQVFIVMKMLRTIRHSSTSNSSLRNSPTPALATQ